MNFTVVFVIGSLSVGIGLLIVWINNWRTWRDFRDAFPPAHRIPSSTRRTGSSCSIVVTKRTSEGSIRLRRLLLVSPQVEIQQEGLAFFVAVDPFRLFSPVLIRFDQVRSYNRVRKQGSEHIEVECAERHVRAWLDLPTHLSGHLSAQCIVDDLASDRLTAMMNCELAGTSPLADNEYWPAGAYERVFGFSQWTAEALETLNPRCPWDAYCDVDKLWSAVYEFHCQRSWLAAERVLSDPVTSDWLTATLRDAMSRPGSTLLRDTSQVLKVARHRLNRALGLRPALWDQENAPTRAVDPVC
jgi:hypothetical protein